VHEARDVQEESAMSTRVRHILVAHDFSETGEHALELALDLATELHARVTIMHAFEVPTLTYPGEGLAMTTEVADGLRKASAEALDRLVARARGPGLEIRTLLREGRAWSEIDSAAKETDADLIVMGTHGRQGLARALMGSTAERVVRTAPCPVLTVPGPRPG